MKPSFHTVLVIQPDDDGKNWRLVEPFEYESSIGTISVPAGFKTDFASIPQAFWNILPPWGKYGKAAVVHDYLYRTPGAASKPIADAIFLEAMKALHVSWLVRYAMFVAVRCCGGGSYKGGL